MAFACSRRSFERFVLSRTGLAFDSAIGTRSLVGHFLFNLILQGARRISNPTNVRSVLERFPTIFFTGGGSLRTRVGMATI
jgi:hypothetical protein